MTQSAEIIRGDLKTMKIFKKYKVDYCGRMSDFKNAKSAYRAGRRVVLYYRIIGTDTDYAFYVDGKRVNTDYTHKKGFIIKFRMPAHDIRVRCESRNSMCVEELLPDGM